MLSGPVRAFVERVIDGDTLYVRAYIWLEQEIRVMVRVNGVDAPELNGRCPYEKQLARSAKSFVESAVGRQKVLLQNITRGKYGGRVIASVGYARSRDLATELLQNNLARKYSSGQRKLWCRNKSRNNK
jgi:endonuclease YncB( thermonuclease family)